MQSFSGAVQSLRNATQPFSGATQSLRSAMLQSANSWVQPAGGLRCHFAPCLGPSSESGEMFAGQSIYYIDRVRVIWRMRRDSLWLFFGVLHWMAATDSPRQLQTKTPSFRAVLSLQVLPRPRTLLPPQVQPRPRTVLSWQVLPRPRTVLSWRVMPRPQTVQSLLVQPRPRTVQSLLVQPRPRTVLSLQVQPRLRSVLPPQVLPRPRQSCRLPLRGSGSRRQRMHSVMGTICLRCLWDQTFNERSLNSIRSWDDPS